MLTFPNFNFEYIKIKHIYTNILQVNVHVLTVLRCQLYKKWLIWFYAVFIWFDYLMTVPYRSKNVELRVLDMI
jgi:hypothetical protein